MSVYNPSHVYMLCCVHVHAHVCRARGHPLVSYSGTLPCSTSVTGSLTGLEFTNYARLSGQRIPISASQYRDYKNQPPHLAFLCGF